MLYQLAQSAPMQRVQLLEWEQRGVDLQIWRLDQLDVAAPGNKLFKLDANLRGARAAGYSRVLSFGGAFSNHIHALALTGAAQGFSTVGIIRGEADAANNPTLSDAVAAGMQLHFVDRSSYRMLSKLRHGDDLGAALGAQFVDCYVIPEGGANDLGVIGCKVLGAALANTAHADAQIVLPCATGTTLAGLVAGLNNANTVLGVAVLKGAESMAATVRTTLNSIDAHHCTRWSIDTAHHGGGYARMSADLEQFIANFQQQTRIPIEPVYSGKMLYAIHRRIERDDFERGTRLIALHTGGLQGMRGFGYRKTQQMNKAGFSHSVLRVG
ncbi:MAG: hypothetical protein JWM78_3197 [Verrucomicrobiaceae bacterium]|nr:hypothetical protein [Verrucomicrobiaceae bacterium]